MLERLGHILAEHWTSGVEVAILAVAIYYIYIYLRGTHGARILIGLALVFLSLTLVSQLLNLEVIGWLLRSMSVFLAIALVVIFQPELRRALTELGKLCGIDTPRTQALQCCLRLVESGGKRENIEVKVPVRTPNPSTCGLTSCPSVRRSSPGWCRRSSTPDALRAT